MNRIRRSACYLLAVLGLTALACSSPLVKAEELSKINEDWSKRQFVALQDIQSPIKSLESDKEVLFQKGTKVKVWVEGAEDWVRVKAYPAAETREETRGRVIIYIFNEDLTEQDRKTERIQQLLRNKFNSLLAET